VDHVADIFFNYLRDIIYDPDNARLDPENLPEDFQGFAKGLLYYTACVREASDIAQDLSKGNLYGRQPSPGNEVASSLKSLCAALRHLTWQAKQVAQGDYNQKVDFMGEFAEAFNVMIEQLNARQTELLEEIENGKRNLRALAQSRSLFEVIASQMPQWIIVMDKSGMLRHMNHPVNLMLSDMVFEERLHDWLMKQSEETKPVPRVEELELYGNAKEQFFRVAVRELPWDEYDALVFILTDVSSSRARLKKLENIAYHDPLTKTYNRHYGMEIFAEWLEQRNVFICCFVDMDNLKYVNDKFGHNEGDEYILSVADTLKQFSDNTVVCRLGGDEFMLLATDWTEDKACRRMEALRDELVAMKHRNENTYRRSVSYGIAEVGADNRLPAGELLRIADEKMYAYKRKNKIPPSVSRTNPATGIC
jgi:diguanylate cyclase (GGDEF)-like protein